MSNDTSGRDLRALLVAVESAGWDYARIELEDLTVVVSDGRTTIEPQVAGRPGDDVPAAAPAPASRGPEVSATEIDTATGNASADAVHGDVDTVESPSIGIVWRSPKPGAPPFVEVGDTVGAEDTLCIIEVMKLMTHVKAGVAGRVVRFHAANGDTVEYGTPLVDISTA